MNEFALRLHRELSGDVCWSPYSVAAALHIALRLASGETRAELLELLGSPELPGEHPPDFAVVDRVWAREGMNLPEPVRWFDDAATALKLINADVAETTRGLIPELLRSLSPDTTAVLVNALYLKVAWAKRFTSVGKQPFGASEVPSMRLTRTMRYAEVDGWRVAAIPAHDDVEAVVLMHPDSMEPESGLLDAGRPVDVRLTMPLLDLRTRLELAETLRRLGLRGMFRSGVDFPDPRLRIDEVIHETVLRVDEDGLEGAAATAMVSRGRNVVPADPVEFRVDGPFVFVVRHAVTGAIYFMARVLTL